MLSADSPAGTGPSGPSPGSLIVTFAGLYLRELGGWIAVADLIKLLVVAGQAPPAVRQALVRLKSRGFLTADRQAGRAGYRLTQDGLADLAIGDGRIFRYGEADESHGWVLAVFSVPEHNRSERHRLRTQLTWLGFGTVGPGVWVAPATLADRAQSHIRDCGLDEYVTWFTGQAMKPDVERWWDLDALTGLYEGFLDRWQPAVERRDSTGRDAAEPTGPGVAGLTGQAMASYLSLVDSWRQFPRVDPGLPATLLPAKWPGRRAFGVFSALHARWSADAERFVRAQLSG